MTRNKIHKSDAPSGLDAEAATEYKRQRRILVDSLVLLKYNASVLRRLASYPAKFLGPARTLLFLIRRNFWENSLLVAHRLWNENDIKSVSLRTVARLAQDKDPQRQSMIKSRLKQVRPDEATRLALARIGRYRHIRLGHLDKHYDIEDTDAQFPLNIGELEQVAEFLANYYNAIEIDGETFFGSTELGTVGSRRSEVDVALDGIAIRSPWVTQYSEDPEWWWDDFRPKLTQEEFQFLVDLRGRMGLPPMNPLTK